jgi:hypothetical protein
LMKTSSKTNTLKIRIPASVDKCRHHTDESPLSEEAHFHAFGSHVTKPHNHPPN